MWKGQCGNKRNTETQGNTNPPPQETSSILMDLYREHNMESHTRNLKE